VTPRVESKRVLRDFYEKEARRVNHQESMYFDSKDVGLWWHRKRLGHVYSYLHQCLKSPEVTTFLDVGCAEGYYISLVSHVRRDLYCVGADVSRSYLKKAKARNPNSEFILCDAELLPFKKRAFDLSLCSEVLEHLPSYPRALEELLDVSKMFLTLSFPGHSLLHKIISIFPSLRTVVDRLFAHDVGHISEVTVDSVKSIVEARKKWKTLDITQSGVLPVEVYKFIPSIRSIDIIDDILCKFLIRKSTHGIATIQVIKISAKDDGES